MMQYSRVPQQGVEIWAERQILAVQLMTSFGPSMADIPAAAINLQCCSIMHMPQTKLGNTYPEVRIIRKQNKVGK